MRHEWVKRHNTKSFGPCWWALASRYLPLTTCHLKHVEPCDRQRLWSAAHTQTRTYRRAPLSRKFGNSPVIRLKVQWSSHLQRSRPGRTRTGPAPFEVYARRPLPRHLLQLRVASLHTVSSVYRQRNCGVASQLRLECSTS